MLPHMSRARKQRSSLPVPPDRETAGTDLPGYPLYPATEDMFQSSREASEIDPDDITHTKAPNEEPGTNNEKSSEDEPFGGDLDVPGSELDDEREKDGNEDEENNSYSLGSDEQTDHDEDTP
jgi:hypothetical protein